MLFQGFCQVLPRWAISASTRTTLILSAPEPSSWVPTPGARIWPFRRSTASRIPRRSLDVGCANISITCAAARSSLNHLLVKLQYCFTLRYRLKAHRNLWQMAISHFFSDLNMKSVCLPWSTLASGMIPAILISVLLSGIHVHSLSKASEFSLRILYSELSTH